MCFHHHQKDFGNERIVELEGQCVDDLDVEIQSYDHPDALVGCAADDDEEWIDITSLKVLKASETEIVEVTLVSHLLRSNCPVVRYQH